VRTARWRVPLAIGLLTLLAAVLRLRGIRFGLPQLMTRPDEETIASVAAHILGSGPNPGFFRYPTLFIYVVAFLDKLRFGSAGADDASYYVLNRVTAAVLGTATVPLLYGAARRLFSETTSICAAALLAVAFLHVRDSHFGVTDVPATFMIVLAFYLVVARRLDLAHVGNVALAAVACGLAASTKYNALIVVAPLVVGAAQQNNAGRRIDARTAVAVLCVIGAGVVAGFVLGTPYALLAHRQFVQGFMLERAHLSAGHAVAEGLGWTRHLMFSLRWGLGAPFLVAALTGAVWMAVAEPRVAAVALAFPVVYYVAFGSSRTVFVRYMTPMVPFAAVLAAFAVDRVAAATARSRRSTVAPVVAAGLTILVGFGSLTRSLALGRLLEQTDSRALAAEWVQSRFPHGVTLHQTGSQYGHVQLFPEGVYQEWSFDGDASVFALGTYAMTGAPQLVIVQSSPLVAYSDVPASLGAVLARRYRLAERIDVENRASDVEPVFDQQDAFFAPLSGFERFTRPGPTIQIFVLEDGTRAGARP
jgi:4-amino-4-deoxy-L-arabinose transferase-like glycosyltransferase